MDKDVELRLREKYALIDKSDPDQIAEAQKVNEIQKGKLFDSFSFFCSRRLALISTKTW